MVDSYMKRVKMYQVFNVIGFILTIFVNGLANAIPLNGRGTGEISDSYLNLFTPAGITFAIWGVIYFALGLFIFYQLGIFSKGKKQYLDVVFRIGWLFFIASIANTAWIFAWHYEQIFMSVLIMLILLIALISIYEKVYLNKPGTLAETISSQWSFSIYLGWISVATIANITIFLVSINWNGLGIPASIWTMAVILVVTIITLRFVFYKKDIPYALVILWALFGILLKHLTFFNSQYKGIIMITIFSMIIILISIFSIPTAYQTQRS